MFGFLASELPVELCRKPENCSKGHLLKGCNENMAQKVIFISLIFMPILRLLKSSTDKEIAKLPKFVDSVVSFEKFSNFLFL